MNKTRKRSAEIRARWNKTGYECNLSLDELEPLFSVYFDNPKGKVVVVDKTKPITLDNLKSLTYEEYQEKKLESKLFSQARAHHESLKRFNQPVQVTVNDIYQLISQVKDRGKNNFSLKNTQAPVSLDNLSLLSGGRSLYFKKLRKNAEQKIIYWKKKGYRPLFTLTQLTELMESVNYELVSSKKGLKRRERIRIIDKSEPLTLSNISILVKASDEYSERVVEMA